MQELKRVLFGLAGFLSVALTQAAEVQRPNIILFLADDMGVTDVGAFHELYPGCPEEQLAHRYTPNLDRLAEQGIRCTRAYAAAWCAPSRQMLLSGQWVNRRNAYDHPWIGSQLRQEGYVTGLVGKSHGGRPIAKTYRNMDPKTAEFDDGFFFNGGCRRSYLEKGETFPGRRGLVPFTFTAKGGEYLTDVYNDHAVEFIERNAGRPFMLYLPYNAPHGPLDGKPEDLRKLFPEVFAEASDEDIISGPLMVRKNARDRTNKLAAMHFAAMVYRMDLGIGRIMKALEEQGIIDNTLVIFTSDNARTYGYGEWLAENHPFTGHKSEMLDGGIRVPFFVWSAELAKSKQSGQIYDGLVSLADIAPTLMRQATSKPYAHPTDGADLMPYLSGERAPLKDRTWFCALQASPEKMSGIEEFSESGLDADLVHLAYVRDDRKLLCWIPQNDTAPGATHARLPKVVGMADPAKPLCEQTPKAGVIPMEGPGRALYDEMVELIRAGDDSLVPVWSGITGKTPVTYSWKSLAKEGPGKE
jgi:arylsulfatase A-like enzyme